jgi:hypothetical protein
MIVWEGMYFLSASTETSEYIIIGFNKTFRDSLKNSN